MVVAEGLDSAMGLDAGGVGGSMGLGFGAVSGVRRGGRKLRIVTREERVPARARRTACGEFSLTYESLVR